MSSEPAKEEQQQLAAALAGDRASFDALVAQHREGLWRFCVLLCSSEADDIVQEAIATAWSSRDRYAGRARFSSWLYGIARNLCRRALRNKARHAQPVEPAKIDARAGARGVLSSVVRRELAARLDCAIGGLPLSMREVFVLRMVEGLDFESIGEITGLRPGTARVRAHRARSLLRGELGSVVDTLWREDSK